MIYKDQKVLIISPHLDDETLGLGGTIAKFIKNKSNVAVLYVSAHLPPLYSKKEFKITYDESIKASKILGINKKKYLNIPATKINEVEVSKLNKMLDDYLQFIKPTIVFMPFPDRHIDHKLVFESSMVVTRPIRSNFPKLVLCYEILSETFWNAPSIEPSFNPDLFVDITNFMAKKKKALGCYKSQIINNPSRNIDACIALAKLRGSQNGCKYAEAFKVVRFII